MNFFDYSEEDMLRIFEENARKFSTAFEVKMKKLSDKLKKDDELFRKKFLADAAKWRAAFFRENELQHATNTHQVDTCAAVEVVPMTGVVVDVNVADDVDEVPMDEMGVGSEFQTAKPVVDIHVNIGNEEPHLASVEPPLVCVALDFSLQVPTTLDALVHEGKESILFVGEIGTVVTSYGSIAQLKVVQTAHVFHDPFLVHCRPFDFVVADYYVRSVRLSKPLGTQVFVTVCFLVVRHSEGLLTYVGPRLLFDPGGFEDESFRTGRE